MVTTTRALSLPYRVLSIVLISLLILSFSTRSAFADEGDTLPGYLLSGSAVLGRFDPAEDPSNVRDVFQVYLYAGETLDAALWWTPVATTGLRLFDSTATDPALDVPVASSTSSDVYSPGDFAQVMQYTAPADSTYSIEVLRPSASVAFDYELYWSVDDGYDDDIPGATLTSPLEDSTYSSMLNFLIDTDDVLPLELVAGDTVMLTLAHEQPGPYDDFDLFLCAPGTASVVDGGYVAWSVTDGTAHETLTYTAGVSGTHYVDVFAYNGSGPYTLETTVVPSSITVTEVQGADRIETAIAAAALAFPGGADTVIIATASKWPDALGGSALAGALDAPILLTQSTGLSSALAAEIVRMGASRVIVLGGESAVGGAVLTALEALPGVTDIERIAGSTRYATAEKIAERTISEVGPTWDGMAFVATGRTFPDALGASPLSAAREWPIYLASPDTATHAALVGTMDADGVSGVLILGGTGAVADTLEVRLDTAFGNLSVDRLAGDSRYETALAVAEYAVTEQGLTWDGLALTTGRKFPDALAGGVMQGKVGSVMVLTTPDVLEPLVGAVLLDHRADIFSVRFLGGTGALSVQTRSQVLEALQ